MKNTLTRTLLLAAALLAVGHPAAAGDDHEEKVMRNLDLNLAAHGVEEVAIDVPVGHTIVEGNDGSQVRVEVDVRCSRPVKNDCAESARQLQLASKNRDGRLEVSIQGWPKSKNKGLSLGVRVFMPSALDLDAEMGVGEFEARGLTADLALDLGVGEVSIHGLEENVRSVDLEVGVGEAVLRLGDREIEGKGFIGRELEWRQGKGQGAVEVDCGVGEVKVRLDD